MRLHIGKACTEQFAQPVNSDLFDGIDMLAATVITATRIALGVFVGQDRALRQKHIAADDVFGRDQFNLVLLAVKLVADGISDGGVGDAGGFGSVEHGKGPFRRKKAIAPLSGAR